MEFGTKVNIESVGVRICEDRGSAITEGHIDVYVNSLSVAQSFGRKNLKVEIIGGN
jgi:3D (Asp-Asp-Asp) domain-containing protein